MARLRPALLLTVGAVTVAASSAAITTTTALARPAQTRRAAGRTLVAGARVAAAATGSSILFGATTIAPSRDSNPRGVAEAFPFVAAQTGTPATVSIYVGAGTSASRLWAGVYGQVSGHPGSLLAAGAATSLAVGSWDTVSVSPASVTAGATYWLAVLGTGGTLFFTDRGSSSCASFTASAQNLTELPATWSGSKRWATCPLSAYATGSTTPVPPPANVTAPAVSGVAVSGATLSVSNGAWNPTSSTYRYSWQQCDAGGAHCVAIGAAAAQTYTLGAGDIGHTLRAVVTATDPAGSTSISTPATAVITSPPLLAPVNTAAPTLFGGSQVGQTVSATTGSWTNSPTAYAYQWQGCDSQGAACAAIAGATASSYTLVSADAGATIRVVITATNLAGSGAATSSVTPVITTPPPPVLPPVNLTAPAVSGGSQVGQTVSATTGTWSNAPTSYAYQWQDCDAQGTICSAVAGATASGYTLAAGDVGHAVRVIVTATNSGGSTAAASGHTAVVTNPVGTGCTSTVASMSALSTAVQNAAGGSTICLVPGSYTGMQLSGTHSADVTVEPEPTLDPNRSGKVTIGLSSTVTDGFGGLVAADVAPNTTHLVIHDFYFTGELSIAHGSSNITVSNNDMTETGPTGGGEYINFGTSDCTVPNAPSWANCSALGPVSNVTISGNNFHDNNQTTSGGDDVLHTNDFRNLTITGNQWSNIVENNAGGHVDCLQNVYGGTGLTFSDNYEHDNECQGFFIKDGDITNVTFDENLFLRDNVPATNGGSSYSLSQAWNTGGLVAEHNTVWDSKGLGLRCISSTVPCTAAIDHNLLSIVNNGSTGDAVRYSLADSYNVFATNPWTFTKSSTDVVNTNPAFMCGSNCGNGTVAGDDYRLASNPSGIGINWAPSQQTYGPNGA